MLITNNYKTVNYQLINLVKNSNLLNLNYTFLYYK